MTELFTATKRLRARQRFVACLSHASSAPTLPRLSHCTHARPTSSLHARHRRRRWFRVRLGQTPLRSRSARLRHHPLSVRPALENKAVLCWARLQAFGRQVVSVVLRKEGIGLDEADVECVFHHVYDSFVEGVDAIDYGSQCFESDKPARYNSSTDLSSRVARFNSDWWEKNPDQDHNFVKAAALTGLELNDAIGRAVKAAALTGLELNDAIGRAVRIWLPARTIVSKAMKAREEDGKILIMREWTPWKDHLYELEAEMDGQVWYVVYMDMMRLNWRLQRVPVEKGSFKSRCPLPEQWRELRDSQLSEVTGIDKCVFVHAAGFIGRNEEFDGAMQMARKALGYCCCAHKPVLSEQLLATLCVDVSSERTGLGS